MAVPASSAARPTPTAGGAGSATAGAQQACPGCGFPQTGRFCEGCGYDFTTGITPGGTTPAGTTPAGTAPGGTAPGGTDHGWTAVVTADRDYFAATIARGGQDAGDLTFPPYCPERSFPLSGEQIRIGRRSVSRGLAPEIDLTGPPLDPGVSHLHVLLLCRPDGSWQVVDPGSANGTLINDAADPIETNVPVPVSDGDRIHLGAWTTITLRNQDSQ